MHDDRTEREQGLTDGNDRGEGAREGKGMPGFTANMIQQNNFMNKKMKG